MKRLVILLDGTWNDQLDNTNVWRFKVMVSARSTDGAEQRVFYHPGVGTHWYDRFRGGVFGQGLYENVQTAYQWLLENYEPNDEVSIFGFSRGAYTGRSLGGMITKCGLLVPGAPLSLRQVFALYRLGDRLRPLYHLEYLKRTGMQNEPPFNREEALLLECSNRIPIKMIGVWDTVGALGIPVGVFTGINRRDYGFLHTRLSNIFERSYQALAVDEQRKEYDATLWTRFVPKVPDRPVRAATARPRSDQVVEQRWFLGAHSNVGGGYPNDPLVQLSLEWMRGKAEAAGLAFRAPVHLNGNEHLADVTDSFAKFLGGAYRLVRRRLYRRIQRPPVEKDKGHVETVNETIDSSVVRKWVGDPKYRPKNLVEWEQRTGKRVAELTVVLLVSLGLLSMGTADQGARACTNPRLVVTYTRPRAIAGVVRIPPDSRTRARTTGIGVSRNPFGAQSVVETPG